MDTIQAVIIVGSLIFKVAMFGVWCVGAKVLYERGRELYERLADSQSDSEPEEDYFL